MADAEGTNKASKINQQMVFLAIDMGIPIWGSFSVVPVIFHTQGSLFSYSKVKHLQPQMFDSITG